LPRHGTAGSQGRRAGHDLLQRSLQPPCLKTAHHIGSQLNTGSDFGKLRCTLEQAHIPVSPHRRNGSCQTANTATRNQHLLVHGLLLCRLVASIEENSGLRCRKPCSHEKARQGGLFQRAQKQIK
jgi:hypothetical protein